MLGASFSIPASCYDILVAEKCDPLELQNKGIFLTARKMEFLPYFWRDSVMLSESVGHKLQKPATYLGYSTKENCCQMFDYH